MAMLSANVANLYDAQINKAFFMHLNLYPTQYTQWCQLRTSSHQFEKITIYGEMPMPSVVGEYENAPEVEFTEGPIRTWTHVKYAHTLIASNEALDDERFPVLVKGAAALGETMTHRLETQGAYDLNVSFSVNKVGKSNTPDEYLCSLNHSTFTGAGGSSTQDNTPSTDVTLGADSLWAAVDNFSILKDREDNPIMKVPKTLIIYPTNKRTAIEILQSTNMPYKSTRELNALRTEGLTYRIGQYLTTNTTAWWVITANKPIIFYMRKPPNVEPDSTIRNASRSWTISMRISHGPEDWYDIYGTDGAP